MRQRKALSQLELAQKAGVDRSTISRLESHAESVFPATVRKLAAALDVTPEDLLTSPQGTAGRPYIGQRAPASRIPPELNVEDSARDFLVEHAEILPLLRQATQQLRRYFPQARLRLQLLEDPDYGEDQR